jgi:hypothetical protein
LQNQREIGVGLLEKLLKLDHAAAEKFYGIYRDQYNPDLPAPDSVVEEWIAVGTFRAKKKSLSNRRSSTIGPSPSARDVELRSRDNFDLTFES